MANEVVYQVQATLSNGGVQDNYSSGSQAIDQTTSGLAKNTQGIGTTAAGEALDIGNLTTPGMSYFVNLDNPDTSTEYIEIGVESGGTFYPLVKLKAGEKAFFRLTTTTPRARSSAGTISLMYGIYED